MKTVKIKIETRDTIYSVIEAIEVTINELDSFPNKISNCIPRSHAARMLLDKVDIKTRIASGAAQMGNYHFYQQLNSVGKGELGDDKEKAHTVIVLDNIIIDASISERLSAGGFGELFDYDEAREWTGDYRFIEDKHWTKTVAENYRTPVKPLMELFKGAHKYLVTNYGWAEL